MSMNATLNAEKRTESGKGAARKLRASGRIPAVVYGQGNEAISLTLDAHEADLLFHRISVENTIVNLEVAGGDQIPTLVREVQVHPFRNQILHVDFYKFEAGVEVEVEIPVHLDGTPKGVKFEGGVLQQIIHDIEVACIPSKIPDALHFDVTGMAIGDVVHVSDLEFPEGVRPLIDEARTLAVVDVPRAALEDEEGEDAPEPELIGEDEDGESEDGEASDEDEDEE